MRRPSLHIRDPEDLALAYLLPTIFIAVFFGSTLAVTSSFASGLAAAYIIYPPQVSIWIHDPNHVAELGFIVLLAITASKARCIAADVASCAVLLRTDYDHAAGRAHLFGACPALAKKLVLFSFSRRRKLHKEKPRLGGAEFG